MNWLAQIFGTRPQISAPVRNALDRYGTMREPDLRQPLHALRCVVVDVESSGLNPYRHKLISIGAVALSENVLLFGQSFEVVLRQALPSDHSNILVHRIDGTTQISGRDPAEGLADFLLFAGRAPLIGFHSDFDRVLINRATREWLGMKPKNRWLDLAFLAPALFVDRAPRVNSLDDWMQVFGIENYSRHNAVADAVATGQLFQIVSAEAARRGMRNCRDLIKLEKSQRWLGAHR